MGGSPFWYFDKKVRKQSISNPNLISALDHSNISSLSHKKCATDVVHIKHKPQLIRPAKEIADEQYRDTTLLISKESAITELNLIRVKLKRATID